LAKLGLGQEAGNALVTTLKELFGLEEEQSYSTRPKAPTQTGNAIDDTRAEQNYLRQANPDIQE